jgi:hypothetical protein
VSSQAAAREPPNLPAIWAVLGAAALDTAWTGIMKGKDVYLFSSA